MLDHVLADPVAAGRVLAREWHSECVLVVVFTFEVVLLEGHGRLKLGLIGLKGLNNLLVIFRLSDLLLKNGEFLDDLFLVLLELLHSPHVKHISALEVGSVEIREAVSHEVVAHTSVHDDLPGTVGSGEELVVVGVTGHAHHTGGDFEESLEALLLVFDEVDSVQLSQILGNFLPDLSLFLLCLFSLLELSLEFLLGKLLLLFPGFFGSFGHVFLPFFELLLGGFLVAVTIGD